MLRKILLLLLLLWSPALAGPSKEDIDPLLGLLQWRLELAKEVARSKWNSHAPIEDLPREKAILQALVEQAKAYSLEPQFVETFFQAQIHASKTEQRHWHQRWKSENAGPFAETDLNVIRRRLDKLTPLTLQALRDSRPLPRDLLEERIRVIFGDSLSEAEREALAPLRNSASTPILRNNAGDSVPGKVRELSPR